MRDLLSRLKFMTTRNVQIPDYPGEAAMREVARDALAEIEKLRAALKPFALTADNYENQGHTDHSDLVTTTFGLCLRARAALA